MNVLNWILTQHVEDVRKPRPSPTFQRIINNTREHTNVKHPRFNTSKNIVELAHFVSKSQRSYAHVSDATKVVGHVGAERGSISTLTCRIACGAEIRTPLHCEQRWKSLSVCWRRVKLEARSASAPAAAL